MTAKNKKVFADVYKFYESIEKPKNSDVFWLDAVKRMEKVLKENELSDLCRDLLLACYNDAARKIE